MSFQLVQNFFEFNRALKVVNGTIEYFIKGHWVKPNECQRFRSEIVAIAHEKGLLLNEYLNILLVNKIL